MNVYFYNNTKRLKSTAAAPTYTAVYDCVFKNPTSLLSPVLTLSLSSEPTYNYFSIGNRYYWITEIISLKNDLWQITGKIDALGTFRKHIQNTRAFVLYDSTANTEIPDSRLGVYTTPTVQSNTGVMPWSFASGTGTYFIAIEGDGDLVDQNMADGATGIYITDMSSIQKIGLDFDGTDVWDSLNTAMTTPFPANIKLNTSWGYINCSKDIFDAIEDSLNNNDVPGVIGYGLIGWMLLPWTFWTGLIGTIKGLITGADALKHVKSAYWLPFDFSTVGSQKDKLAIGSYIDQIGTSKLITDPIKDTYAAVSIPWQYTDWRNVQNTEIQVYIPLIGVINIPASAVRGQTVITIKCSINLYSGHFSVRLECGGVDLGTFGANTMMPILVGDSNPDIPAITNTIVAGAALAAGAATGTAALTAGAAGAFIQSGLGSIQPISTTVGGIGGGCGNSLGNAIVCTTICHNTSQEPSALLSTIGTPTNQLKTLSGSGYCQCLNAQVNCNPQAIYINNEITNANTANFNDTIGNLALKKLMFTINSNSGLTGANIFVRGSNLWNEVWELGNIDDSGQTTPSAYRIRSKDYIPCKPSTTYYFKTGLNIARLFYYDENKTFISRVINPLNVTFTTPNNCHYLKFRSADNVTSYDNSISINFPSSDTTYHAYNAASTNTVISWNTAGTVYEGIINVTDGELIVSNGSNGPGIYHINPVNVYMLQGVNNIFVDTGIIADLIYQLPSSYFEPDPTQTEIEMINAALNSGIYLE